MNAAHLLKNARAAGLSLEIDGENLIVEADRDLPAELIAELREHKTELMAILSRRDPDAGSETTDTAVPPDKLSDTAPRTLAPKTPLAPEPGGAEAAWWRRRFTISTIHWELSGKRTKAEAERLAYAQLLDDWRRLHGTRWPVWQCAGCGKPIGGLSALSLTDGNRVHFGEKIECLTPFGRRSHGDAIAALRALKLKPPPGFESP